MCLHTDAAEAACGGAGIQIFGWTVTAGVAGCLISAPQPEQEVFVNLLGIFISFYHSRTGHELGFYCQEGEEEEGGKKAECRMFESILA